MLFDDLRRVAVVGRALGRLVLCGGVHATALLNGSLVLAALAPCATRRSMKNSTPPRGPGGDCQLLARRAMSRKASADGQPGKASTTASWRWIARRSHSSRGTAPR